MNLARAISTGLPPTARKSKKPPAGASATCTSRTLDRGIIQFDKAFNAQLDKDGIIIDERYNRGGQIPDFLYGKN